MISSQFRVLQCNCQRAYAVMCDLSGVIVDKCVTVALLQELYVINGRMSGLPIGWDVYTYQNEPIKAAVVVNDVRGESMCVSECTSEYGVCVWIKRDFGELYVVSMYCRHGHGIEPYLA